LTRLAIVLLFVPMAVAGCGGTSNAQMVDQAQLLKSALAHRQAHEYAKCIEDYSLLLSANPALVEAYMGRADCHDKQGDRSAALPDYSAAIRLSPADPNLFVLRGTDEMAVGNNTAAYSDYKKVMTLPAAAPAQFVSAAQGLETIGFLADARALTDLGIRLYDHYWPLHTARADIEKQLGNESEALHEFEIALSLAPGSNQLWPLEDRGGYYLQLGRYDLALADFNRILALDRTHYDFFEGRAQAKIGLGDLKGAGVDLTTAIDLVRTTDPTNSALLESLSGELSGLGSHGH
jgi:tetratricopeptide (TPR) repeat protein